MISAVCIGVFGGSDIIIGRFAAGFFFFGGWIHFAVFTDEVKSNETATIDGSSSSVKDGTPVRKDSAAF